ncbi:regulator of the ubiquitin pathway, putative, partial [Ixodes scapularis]
MEAQRDQVLADFQSCTGMEDVGECFMYLENANWNLLDAVHRALPQETQSLPSEQQGPPQEAAPPVEMPPSTLDVRVEYRGRTLPLVLPRDGVTCGDIRAAIHQETGLAPCRQVIQGWANVSDEVSLAPFAFPALFHCWSSLQMALFTSASPELPRFGIQVRLNITDETTRGQYSINFPHTKTFLQVKQDVSDLTSIPVRHQRWTGWPQGLLWDHVRRPLVGWSGAPCGKRWFPAPFRPQPIVDLVSSDSSSLEEFEDANECLGMLAPPPPTCRTRAVPESAQDEGAAVAHFTREFASRYGTCHPVFFQGSLSEALQASCHKPCRERKPLAIYLHHDDSVLTQVFCTQLLCSEAIVAYLALNFVTWVWDLTLDSNRLRFLATVGGTLGPAVSSAVQSTALDCLPALVVVTRVRSATEVLTLIPGNVGLDELMTRLVHTVEVFNSEMSTEMQEEKAREEVKREQDAAYEASLLADRAKEEIRKMEQEEQLRRETAEEVQKQLHREELRHQEQMKEALQQSLAQLVPEEPAEDEDRVSHIRVRLPSGEVLSRRFLASCPLSSLLTFLASRGFPVEEYKVLASWPRRDVS